MTKKQNVFCFYSPQWKWKSSYREFINLFFLWIYLRFRRDGIEEAPSPAESFSANSVEIRWILQAIYCSSVEFLENSIVCSQIRFAYKIEILNRKSRLRLRSETHSLSRLAKSEFCNKQSTSDSWRSSREFSQRKSPSLTHTKIFLQIIQSKQFLQT